MVPDILAGMLRAVGMRVMDWDRVGSRLVVNGEAQPRHGHGQRLAEGPRLR